MEIPLNQYQGPLKHFLALKATICFTKLPSKSLILKLQTSTMAQNFQYKILELVPMLFAVIRKSLLVVLWLLFNIILHFKKVDCFSSYCLI